MDIEGQVGAGRGCDATVRVVGKAVGGLTDEDLVQTVAGTADELRIRR